MMTSFRNLFLITLFLFSLAYADRVKWSTDLNTQITGGLTLHGNYLYVGGMGTLFKIDTITGKELWKTKVKGYTLKPIYYGSQIIIFTRRGKIYSVSDSTHSIVKEGEINHTILNNPLVIKGVAYIPTDDGVIKYSLDNFDQIWRSKFSCEVSTKPLLVGNEILSLCNDGRVYIVDSNNGEVIKSVKYRTIFWYVNPVLSGSRILMPTYDGRIYLPLKQNIRSAPKIYTKDGRPLSTELRVINENEYLGITTGGLLCDYNNNGETKWCVQLTSGARAPLIVTSKNIYVITSDGTFYGLTRNGEIEWELPLEETIFFPLEKRVSLMYAISESGKIMAISTSSCSILYPEQGSDIAGLDEIEIIADAFADDKISRVGISVNGGNWIETIKDTKDKNSYHVSIPADRFTSSNNEVRCKVSTVSGDEQPPYSKIELVKSSNPSELSVKVPGSVAYGNSFEIEVRDASNNKILNGIYVKFGDLEYRNVNGKLIITPPSKGEYKLVIKKGGYKPFEQTINVGENYTIPIIIIGIILVLLGVFYVLYNKWMEE